MWLGLPHGLVLRVLYAPVSIGDNWPHNAGFAALTGGNVDPFGRGAGVTPLHGLAEAGFLVLFAGAIGLAVTYGIRRMLRRPTGPSRIEQEQRGLEPDLGEVFADQDPAKGRSQF